MALERRMANVPRSLVYESSPEFNVIDGLVRIGRMSETLTPDNESICGISAVTSITDLGRLALRVCPPEES